MTLVKVNNPISKSFDGFFNDLLEGFPALDKVFNEEKLTFPPVNITEKENSYHMEVVAPGWEKENFNIKLDGDVLTINAEKTEETNETSDKVIRREYSKKSFKRSFTLDEKVDVNSINAKYENGVLKLDLPKKENVKAALKDIAVQ